MSGDTLVHTDIRADNVLLRADGTVAIVDWPWGSRGCAWLDTLLLLFNVRFYGGEDVDSLLAFRAPSAAAEDVTAVIAGIAGFLLDQSRRPPPLALPTLRAFQRAQADVAVDWLSTRWR